MHVATGGVDHLPVLRCSHTSVCVEAASAQVQASQLMTHTTAKVSLQIPVEMGTMHGRSTQQLPEQYCLPVVKQSATVPVAPSSCQT